MKRANAWNINTEAMTIWFARSINGGGTFSAPLQVSTFNPATGTNRSHGPQITATSANDVFVSWHTLEAGTLPNPPTTPWKIWVAASTNGGANFGANQAAVTSVWGYPNRFISMGADPTSGRIYLAYADSLVQNPRDYDVFVTSSLSAAGPWSAPTKINDDPTGTGRWQTWPALDVAPNGRVDVIWYDYRDDPNNANVYYSASIDGGTNWSPNLKLSSAAFAWPGGFYGDYSSVAAVNDKMYGAWMDNRLGNQEIFGAAISQQPVDAMLVLDISGSMLSPGCPGCAPKLEVLQDAVEIFVQLWNTLAVAEPEHRLGATYFRTNIGEFKIGNQVLLPIGPGNNNAAAMITDVKAQTTTIFDLTAMGGGLQSAINQLTSTRPRRIILFTDGMQNVNPMVMSVGNALKIDNDPTITQNSNISPTPTPTVLNQQLGRKINTIGVGATPQFVTLLQNIAAKTDGKTYTTTAPDNNLRRFFVEQLVDALRGSSPQLVDYRYRQLKGSYASESFTLNQSTRKLVFKLSWKRGAPPIEMEELEKDGSNVIDRCSITRGDFYRICTIGLPLMARGTPLPTQGDWRLSLRGTEGTAYEVAAIADEKLLEYAFAVDPPARKVGQPLQLSARLSLDGMPVTNADHVTATVLKPGTGLGTALSTTPTPATITGPSASGLQTEPAASAAQKKVELLLQQETFWKSLQPVQTVIELTNRGDGTYTGTYADTDIPGSYAVLFRASGAHPSIGPYTRTATRSADVEFAAADFARSDVVLVSRDPMGDMTQVVIQLRPRDIHGNYLGPDYGHRIEVSTSLGSVRPGYRDLLDGRYEYALSIPTGTDPDIRLAVMGEPLYAGPMSGLGGQPPDYRMALSAHLGGTIPLGSFGNQADSGYLAELDLEYRYSPRYSLNGVLGRYTFDSGPDITGATLYLRRYQPVRPKTDAYVEAGIGVYDPDGLDTAAGLSLGAGVTRSLSPRLRFELGTNYFHLFNEGKDIDFMGIKAGLRFAF